MTDDYIICGLLIRITGQKVKIIIRVKCRPRKRWIDDMKAVFKNSMGLDMFETTQLAKTRQLFLPATPIMGTKR